MFTSFQPLPLPAYSGIPDPFYFNGCYIYIHMHTNLLSLYNVADMYMCLGLTIWNWRTYYRSPP